MGPLGNGMVGQAQQFAGDVVQALERQIEHLEEIADSLASSRARSHYQWVKGAANGDGVGPVDVVLPVPRGADWQLVNIAVTSPSAGGAVVYYNDPGEPLNFTKALNIPAPAGVPGYTSVDDLFVDGHIAPENTVLVVRFYGPVTNGGRVTASVRIKRLDEPDVQVRV